MGLEISALRVRSLEVGRFEVSWETNSYVEPLDYTLQVYRSESPEGPFDPVSPPFTDRYLFVDASVPLGDFYRQFWYQIKVTEKVSGLSDFSAPVSQEPEPDIQASYVRRAQMIGLTQVVGRQVWLFKKRTFGLRCQACFNVQMGQKTRSGCLGCYDTGFVRGFYDPIEVWLQVDPPAKRQELREQNRAQPVLTSARMGYYPNVSPGDILVEGENRRWSIESVTNSERLRAVVHQELTLAQINEKDIEFKLPINLDGALRDLQPSPGRMFTLPADLHATIDERMPNPFANHPVYPRSAPEE